MNVWLEPCERTHWNDFKAFHYMRTPLNKSSKTFLAIAELDGEQRIVGFAASLPLPSGTLRNTWREHKIVARLTPNSRFQKPVWALIADALANWHFLRGKRFYGLAPLEYSGYRETSNLWIPTSKHKKRIEQGYGSHEFIGTPLFTHQRSASRIACASGDA